MSIARAHTDWLSLVPSSGPFLSLPVLIKAFPQGLDAHDAEHARRLRRALDEWDEDQSREHPTPGIHREWIRFVMRETLELERTLAEGQDIPATLKSEAFEHGEELRPDLVVNDPQTGRARLLVQFYPRSQSLTRPVASSRWKASPDTRMMQLLHDTGVRLGIVTNGDHWMLVNAPRNEATGYISWYANLWTEEPDTLRAFRALLGSHRLFGVPEDETLEALLDQSAADQQEVTDQLGYQVRKAVEVLIQALDKANQDHGGELLAEVPETVLYEAALTVMMRLVFLFCAEERELLLLGDELYDNNYAVSTLREQLRAAAAQHGEEILGLRYDAWTRLLTTFRAIHGGVDHDRLKLPAYGGSLFDPDRFPFLEGRKAETRWRTSEAAPLPVSNRTVLHLLEALQVLRVRIPGGSSTEARAVSFRELNIEQIGHVYEGLLDHTATRAAEPVLGLKGTRDREPEIPLSELERLAAKGEPELLKFLKDETGRSESALRKGLLEGADAGLAARFRTAAQGDGLWKRIEPFAGLVRLDTNEYPIVITAGSVYVTAGSDRRSSGTHYTPRSLTEPIVRHTLEPLVYIGPAEGLPNEEWKLRGARELLDLKICDMACGSGAFLVQACRYMGERLLEAWDEVQRANPNAISITPEGEPSGGRPGEMLIPIDPDERMTFALRIIAQRCLYGVDKNPLAVEMAKLSLWLLTLAKDKPFEFLDHTIRCGDSLVGIHDLKQLQTFNLYGIGETIPLFAEFLNDHIADVIARRRRIADMPSNTVEDVQAQEQMLREVNEQMDRLRYAADMLVGAEFVPGKASAKLAARVQASVEVGRHFNDTDLTVLRAKAAKALDGQRTFHWALEFPEVIVERAGFDGFVGNPPFLGGKRISSELGLQYEKFLKTTFDRSKGAADICCYFFRRAFLLTSNNLSCCGMLATSSITEGDSREVSLGAILSDSGKIFRAVRSSPWPGIAGVFVNQIYIGKGPYKWRPILDDQAVTTISSFLDSSSNDTPFRLMQGVRYSEGQKLYGDGFIVTPAEKRFFLTSNPNNAKILRPYLNGDRFNNIYHDVNDGDWAIDFGSMDLNEASQYRVPFDRVTATVKSVRDELTGQIHESRYWLYWDKRERFISEIRNRDRILVCAAVTKYLSFRFFDPNWVFSHQLKLFDLQDYSSFALLQSTIHEAWARQHSSTLGQTLRYSTSDAFDTFAFPIKRAQIEEFGRLYYCHREAIIEETNIGLTDIYNRTNQPDELSMQFVILRERRIEMDYAVAAAYDWSDLDLGHGFHETRQGIRFTISEEARRKVLDRLLKLNHERYAEEVRLGLHDKKKPKAAKKSKKQSTDTPSMFE